MHVASVAQALGIAKEFDLVYEQGLAHRYLASSVAVSVNKASLVFRKLFGGCSGSADDDDVVFEEEKADGERSSWFGCMARSRRSNEHENVGSKTWKRDHVMAACAIFQATGHLFDLAQLLPDYDIGDGLAAMHRSLQGVRGSFLAFPEGLSSSPTAANAIGNSVEAFGAPASLPLDGRSHTSTLTPDGAGGGAGASDSDMTASVVADKEGRAGFKSIADAEDRGRISARRSVLVEAPTEAGSKYDIRSSQQLLDQALSLDEERCAFLDMCVAVLFVRTKILRCCMLLFAPCVCCMLLCIVPCIASNGEAKAERKEAASQQCNASASVAATSKGSLQLERTLSQLFRTNSPENNVNHAAVPESSSVVQALLRSRSSLRAVAGLSLSPSLSLLTSLSLSLSLSSRALSFCIH